MPSAPSPGLGGGQAEALETSDEVRVEPYLAGRDPPEAGDDVGLGWEACQPREGRAGVVGVPVAPGPRAPLARAAPAERLHVARSTGGDQARLGAAPVALAGSDGAGAPIVVVQPRVALGEERAEPDAVGGLHRGGVPGSPGGHTRGVGGPTSAQTGLDWAEMATTAAAVAVSGSCWALLGAPYLARAVVGDTLGFTVLSAVLVARGRRLRHEAAVCLVAIGLVHLAGWAWPLALPSWAWAAVFLVDLACYLALRTGLLRPVAA